MAQDEDRPGNRMKIGNHHVRLPASRIARIVIGVLLIASGFLGFLPVLGFWMVPLGLLVLSQDLPAVRRWRRASAVRIGLWLKPRFPRLAGLFGFNGAIAPRRRPNGD